MAAAMDSGATSAASAVSKDKACHVSNGAPATAITRALYVGDEDALPLRCFSLPRCYEGDLDSVLVPNGLIVDRIHKLAEEVHADVGDKPLVVLCVLKGSYRFFSVITDRLSQLRHNCSFPLVPDFIRVKSYENTKSVGQVEIIGWEKVAPLKDQHVLVVEDLIDTGATMAGLLRRLRTHGPASVRVATLAVKRAAGAPPETHQMADYVGFNLPDKFVVGFGLDYNQKMRDLDHLCVMSRQGIERHRV